MLPILIVPIAFKKKKCLNGQLFCKWEFQLVQQPNNTRTHQVYANKRSELR